MPPPTRDPAWRRWLLPTLGFAALLGLWELWVVVRHIPPYEIPTPGRIGRSAWQDLFRHRPRHGRVDPSLWPDLGATLVIGVEGLVIGAVAGIALALLVVRIRFVRQVLMPLLVISQTIPTIVLAPLFAIWWGYGSMPKVILVALITVFPVLVSTVTGMDDADADLVDLVRSTGAGPGRVLRTVRLPASLPSSFAGLRIAATYAIGGAVIAEYLGGSDQPRGLGFRIQGASQSYEIDRIFVAVALVGVLTAVLFALVDAGARLAMPWQAPQRARSRRRSGRASISPFPSLPKDPA